VPRIFSETDRKALRQALIDAGRESFLRFGLRKTSVEQLARSVGIAKGTFYSFFGGKEDLCAAIFEQEEAQRYAELEAILARSEGPRQTLSSLMHVALDFVQRDSLVTALRESGELAQVMRGATEDRRAQHFRHDTDFVRKVMEACRRSGAACDIDPKVATGVFRAMTTLGFHEAEIGSDVFAAAVDRIVDWVAGGIVGAEVRP